MHASPTMLSVWARSCCRGLQSELALRVARLSTAAGIPARERLDVDVLIVGAGPAGLAAAIKIKQLCQKQQKDLSVCVLEKASTIGAHTLSGCVLDPRSLNELLPDWKSDPTAPIKVAATKDRFLVLSRGGSSLPLPTPAVLRNKGNYIVSLSEVVAWLGNKATELGVEVLPGFPAASLIYDAHGGVAGVATNDQGINKRRQRKPTYQPGTDVMARATLLAEGARGSLSEEVIRRFGLRDKGMQPGGADPQTYALGIKEVWEVPEARHKPGLVIHTVGWPMDHRTYGGGFLYHMDERRVSLGFVVGLDYSNPYLSPFQEFQRWKAHPDIAAHLEGGTCLQYGARSLNEGGLQSIPKLAFPGGALLGCGAGLLNVARIKGTHTALLSGLAAGEAVFRALTEAEGAANVDGAGAGSLDLKQYESVMRVSWAWDELRRVRNVRPGFRWGLIPGLLHAAVDQYLLRGKAWWTLQHRTPDHEHLLPAAQCTPIAYPKPDGKLTFDIPTSLYRSGTNHEHDQPAHLVLKDAGVPERLNGPHYAAPESRYCPAGVYEYGTDAHGRTQLTINAQNCLHCKACDIKDPTQNIRWTTPEGGGGPNYSMT